MDDTQSEDGDCGQLLDFVYDEVMTGQSPYDLEGDGWHADEIHYRGVVWFSLCEPTCRFLFAL